MIAVEPDPVSCAALRASVARSGAANVRIIPLGTWSSLGTIGLTSDGSIGALRGGRPERGARQEGHDPDREDGRPDRRRGPSACP